MVVSKTEPVALSPNQESKRRQVIEAARVVLARDGVSGCTVRAVADASPLTKSAIHYYFRDIDEIVDLAVAAHLDAMLESLRDVAARHRDPDKRLRAVLDAYLAVFTDKPYAAFLWFEYWVTAGRRNRTDAVDDMLHKVHTLLVECTDDLPIDNADQTAHVLLSWLLGTVVQQRVRPRTTKALAAEITGLLQAS